MTEARGSSSEFQINPPDLSGKKDLVSRFARNIQKVLGLKPEDITVSAKNPPLIKNK